MYSFENRLTPENIRNKRFNFCHFEINAEILTKLCTILRYCYFTDIKFRNLLTHNKYLVNWKLKSNKFQDPIKKYWVQLI